MKIGSFLKNAFNKAVAVGAALDEYLVATILFVVIGVAVSIGAYITSQVQSQIGSLTNSCTGGGGGTLNALTGYSSCIPTNSANPPTFVASVAYNAGGNSVTGMSTFATWLPILAIVIIAVVIISLLYGFLTGGGRREAERVA